MRRFIRLSFLFTSLLFFARHSFASNPTVVLFEPLAQAIVSPTNLEIVVEFDQPIDPQSVTNRSFAVFGRWTGVCPGNFVFENNNQRVRFVPSKEFSAGEWITISVSRQIQNSAEENVAAGFAWNFWTRSGPGKLELVETETIDVREPGEGAIRTYGAYAGDLDGDGFHDFSAPNEFASDVRVFMNDGAGNYSDFDTYDLPSNSTPSTNEGADFNGDGFLDFAVGNITGNSMSVFLGNGSGGFAPAVTYPADQSPRGLSVLDLNGDSWPDIVTANRRGNNLSIFLNNGDGTFADRDDVQANIDGEVSCVAADINEDGIIDLFVGSFNSEEIAVMLGDGEGGFEFASKKSSGGNNWMITAGDIDNDSHVDVVTAKHNRAQFAVLFNDGNGNLSDPVSYSVGQAPLAVDVGDIDGDGDLEVVTSNFSGGNWTIYENNGSGGFINPRTLPANVAGSCATLHDRDRDGDLDMTGIDEIEDLIFIFDNPGSITDTTGEPPLPADFDLQQSFPNPFVRSASLQPMIIIPFTLNRDAPVQLELFNVKGQRIATILNGRFSAGPHQRQLDTETLTPGIYFYRLTSGPVTFARRLLVLP
jgi:hypothetical protein